MKKILQIYYGFIIVFSITLMDMAYTSGKFFLMICSKPQFEKMAKNSQLISYSIQATTNGDYRFLIINNSLIPKILFGHKLTSKFKLTAMDLFNLASRKQISIQGIEHTDSYGFDCGTGLGLMTINPYQKFQQLVSYNEIIKWISYSNCREEIANCFSDSIKVRFFLHSYSIVNGLQTDSYSNWIFVATKDLKKHLDIDIKEVLTGEVFINPEIPAVFPGGTNNFLIYFYKNLNLSTTNSEFKSNGVYQFIIDENGNARDVKVMRSMGKPYDDEVISVLNSMPKWIPGKMNGRPIKQKITLPLRIHIE